MRKRNKDRGCCYAPAGTAELVQLQPPDSLVDMVATNDGLHSESAHLNLSATVAGSQSTRLLLLLSFG